jgi:AraC-like DNA-binding protein
MNNRIEEGTVRVGGAMAIPAVLGSLGADAAAVFAEARIDLALFDDPDNLISNAARIHLLNLCAARTECRHFGLLVGQRTGLPAFGLVGFLVQHSPDVGTALRSFVRYLHLHVRGTAPTLAVNGRRASLGYEIHQPRVEAVDQLVDGALAVGFNILRTLCGPDWMPVEVLLAHPKPKDTNPFSRFFEAPLRFDAGQNAVVFSAEWLNHRLPGADPELRRLLQKQIDALDARYSEDFSEQVRTVLRTALLTGHGRADQVAGLFSMHSRTLHRRLLACGTSFQELLDEARFNVARQMLEDSVAGVSEIAEALDYSNASAFTRAFRRWSGTTPAAWRTDQRTTSGRKPQSTGGRNS